MATKKQTDSVRTVRHEDIWQIMQCGTHIMAVSLELAEMPGQFAQPALSPSSVSLPVPVAEDWGDEPIGRWYSSGSFGGVSVGFVRPSSHRDIGVCWPEPRKLPVQIVLDYES